MGMNNELLQEGARNLLINCAGVQAGDRVLVVREERGAGYFDDSVPDLVENEARDLDAHVHSLHAPLIEGPEDFPDRVVDAMQETDHTIFFTRIADQMRFTWMPGSGSKTMCYALGLGTLGSEACRVPYGLMQRTLEKLQGELDRTREWRVTCPLGTDVSGRCESVEDTPDRKPKFTVRLFPLGAFRPFSCRNMSGRLVTQWFPPVFTHRYSPFGLFLEEPISVLVERGRIVEFEGNADLVGRVRRHYEAVGKEFGDPYTVESWHGGTNPKVFSPIRAKDNIEMWGGIMHAHPRWTHFHTCGDTKPGEINIITIDPTIYIDGAVYWQDGRLLFLDRTDVRAVLDDYPGWQNAFEMRRDIGID